MIVACVAAWLLCRMGVIVICVASWLSCVSVGDSRLCSSIAIGCQGLGGGVSRLCSSMAHTITIS